MNKLRWSALQIEVVCDASIRTTTAALDEILASDPSRAFELFAAAERQQEDANAICSFYQHVSPDAAVRAASVAAEKRFSDFEIETAARKDIYDKLKQFDASTLSGEDAFFWTKLLRQFERNGLNLPAEQRETLVQLKKQISDLCIAMKTCLADSEECLLFSAEQLQGTTANFISGLEMVDGKYKLTTQYPHYFGILDNCSVEATRLAVDQLFNTRGSENGPRFVELISLRDQVAKLLGYATYAHYVLEPRMAKSPAAVQRMFDELGPKIRPKAEKEKQELLALPEAAGQTELMNWNMRYLQQLRLQRFYQVDAEAIREFFPLQHVITETLELYQHILGLRFESLALEQELWHPDVQAFAVHDASSEKKFGIFVLDLHPRPNKYTHAAMWQLQNGLLQPDQEAIAAMVCNFPKPTADTPSLLKHNEFVTLFHEFGHVMHGLIGHTKRASLSGTCVERDFVECPSQALENWCWDKRVLQRISKHYKTGEPLSNETIDRMLAARSADSGLVYSRQLFFGIMDQAIHINPTANPHETYAKLRPEITLVHAAADVKPLCSFGHLFGGYECAYYSYLWSEIFSDDIFASIGDCMDQEKTMRYRRLILERGGSRDSNENLLEFLGREPTVNAFVAKLGI